MGEAASVVAAMPGVREALIEAQRAFAARPGGAVLDGRDIGTVDLPRAEREDFRHRERDSARAAARARTGREARRKGGLRGDPRRHRQRDARDSGRAAAPLKPAPDAKRLDTTNLGIEAAVAEAERVVEAARASA